MTDTGAKFSRCGIQMSPAPISRVPGQAAALFWQHPNPEPCSGVCPRPCNSISCLHCAPLPWQLSSGGQGQKGDRKSQTASSRNESQKTHATTLSLLFLDSLLLSLNRWALTSWSPQPGSCLLAAVGPILPPCFCLALGHVTTKPIMSVSSRFMSSFRLHVRHTEVSPEGLPSSFHHKNGLSVLAPCERHKS